MLLLEKWQLHNWEVLILYSGTKSVVRESSEASIRNLAMFEILSTFRLWGASFKILRVPGHEMTGLSQ